MIATQGSTTRDVFARVIKTARRRLRETIERYPDALPPAPRSDCGAFPGMLSIVARHLQASGDPEAAWWHEQALRYANLLSRLKDDSEPAGLGFAFLPVLPDGPGVTDAGRRLTARLLAANSSPSVESLIDAVLVLAAGESATVHCLAARRFLIRGDGSVNGGTGSIRELAWTVYGFATAYRYTRDARFLGTAENCAECLLDSLDGSADAVAAGALLQLANVTGDASRARLYSLSARHLLTMAAETDRTDPLAEYFLLAGATQTEPLPDFALSAGIGVTNGVAHVAAPEPEPVAVQTEPEPVAEKVVEPGPRRVSPLTFLLAPVIFYLLIDVLVFRSNFYTRFIEPESSAGTFEGTFEHELTRQRHPKEILVVGASRIAEGFSAKRVNQTEPKDGYFFSNGAVSGAGPRCMYYMLRDVDPKRNRYKAIVLNIDDYTDPDDYEDLADRVEDLYTVIARLRLTDVLTFMRSYSTHKSKMEVLKGSLVKSVVYQRDLQEFLDHPGERMDKVALFRGHRFDWMYDYGGSEQSLAGTTIDWATKTITFGPGVPKDLQDYLRPRLIINAPQNGKVRKFQVRWWGAIADMYKDSGTRIIFVQPPRTPLPRPVSLAHWDWTTVDDLGKRPWVTVVDHHTFENLEKPELFSDHAHLNSEGQKLFSPALAATVKEILQK